MTKEDDFIQSTSFDGEVTFAEGKEFIKEDGTPATPEDLTGTRLTPAELVTVSLLQDGHADVYSICKGSKFVLPECSYSCPRGKVFMAWSVLGTLYYPGDEITVNSHFSATVLYESDTDYAKARSVSTSFQGLFQMRFYYYLPYAVTKDTGAYALITGGSKEKKIMISDLVGSTSFTGTNCFFTYDVYAKEVRDSINVKLYYSDGSPVKVASEDGKRNFTAKGVETSLMTYLDYCSGLEDEKTAALAEAAKDYCTAAQINFDYKAEGLTLSGALDAVTAETLEPYAAKYAGTMPKGVEIESASVEIQADNSFRLYLKYDGSVSPKEYKYYLDGTETKLKSSGEKYYLKAQNIVARKLGDEFTFTIARGTASYDVTVSVLTYARSCMIYGNENQKNLAKALYLYNQAAVAKFGK